MSGTKMRTNFVRVLPILAAISCARSSSTDRREDSVVGRLCVEIDVRDVRV